MLKLETDTWTRCPSTIETYFFLVKPTGHKDGDGLPAPPPPRRLTPVRPGVQRVKVLDVAARSVGSLCAVLVGPGGRVPLHPPVGGSRRPPTAQRHRLVPEELGSVGGDRQSGCRRRSRLLLSLLLTRRGRRGRSQRLIPPSMQTRWFVLIIIIVIIILL